MALTTWLLPLLQEPELCLQDMKRREGNQRNRKTVVPAPLGIKSNTIKYGTIKALPRVTPETASIILSSREEIIHKPWVYGPFCKKLFDIPYKTNIVFDLASSSESGTLVFLEQDALLSWDFMAALSNDDSQPVRFKTFGDFQDNGNAKCSSLLLSQAADSVIVENRSA